MKRRLTPIITIGVALVLIGSIAYAADRRKQAKAVTDSSPEEESLRAELLDAVHDNSRKLPDIGDRREVAGNKPGVKTNQVKSKK